MFETVEQARTALTAQGWKIQTVQNEKHGTIHQLYDGAGNYIVSGDTADKAWKRAFNRGLLVIDEPAG